MLKPGLAARIANRHLDVPFAGHVDRQGPRGGIGQDGGEYLDRMEKGTGDKSATEQVRQMYGIPVISIATLEDLIGYLATDPGLEPHLEAVRQYRERYGVTADA